MSNKSLEAIAKKIKLIILDVDGVLTNGQLIWTDEPQQAKAFHVRDGLGIKLLQKAGIEIAIITGKQSHVVTARLSELGVKHVYQNVPDKLPTYLALLDKLSLSDADVAYVGDDLPDLPIMSRVALSIAVNDAYGFVKESAQWVTPTKGGFGAVRDVCDLLLSARGELEAINNQFLKDGSALSLK